MKVVVLLTVRNTGTRLPGKALIDIGGKPLLALLIDRYRRCDADLVAVVTTTRKEDDSIARFADSLKVPVYRGPWEDLATSMSQAARVFDADIVVRGLGDCPFADWEVLNREIRALREIAVADVAKVYFTRDARVVYGAAPTVYTRRVIHAAANSPDPFDHEHVSPFVDRQRQKFSIVYVLPPSELYYRGYRLELDTKEDYALIRQLFEILGPMPSLSAVVAYLDRRPELTAINAHIRERTGPLTSYSESVRQQWYQLAKAAVPYVSDGELYLVQSPQDTTPITCKGCGMYLGYARVTDRRSELVRPTGDVLRVGSVACRCGMVRKWH